MLHERFFLNFMYVTLNISPKADRLAASLLRSSQFPLRYLPTTPLS